MLSNRQRQPYNQRELLLDITRSLTNVRAYFQGQIKGFLSCHESVLYSRTILYWPTKRASSKQLTYFSTKNEGKVFLLLEFQVGGRTLCLVGCFFRPKGLE